MKTGCLGPEGSYSALATKKLAPKTEVFLYKNFPEVFNALKTDKVQQIVLPIENTIQGGVLQNMDLLEREEDFLAVEKFVLPIDHRLVMQKDAHFSDIVRVYSHVQAIGQCSLFLSEKLPCAQAVPVNSTAESLSMLKSKNEACIVGAHMCENLKDYTVSGENIADEKKSYTHFVLVKKGTQHLNKLSRHIYFTACVLHRPGALYRLLEVIDGYGLNMTKIESRPIKDTPGEYRFFIEIEGNYLSKQITNAIADMKKLCQKFKILGCY